VRSIAAPARHAAQRTAIRALVGLAPLLALHCARDRPGSSRSPPEVSRPVETGLPPPAPSAAPNGVAAEKCRSAGIVDTQRLAICMEACEAGDMPSCGSAAGFLEVGAGGIRRDQAAALRLYQRACDGGGAVAACFFLGRSLIDGRPGVPVDAVRGRALVEKACRGGDPMACQYLDGVRYTARPIYVWSSDGGAPQTPR
jgi:TPR repeat protein